VYHYANTTVKIRTGGAPKIKVDPQARRFAKWKEEFGGGERGEKLVKTLKKLHEGELQPIAAGLHSRYKPAIGTPKGCRLSVL